MLGDWRWSVTGNYADADQRTFTEQESGARDRFDRSQQSFGTNANISGTVVEGWAGPIRSSIPGGYCRARFDSRTERGVDIMTPDRRSVLEGKRVSVLVTLVGSRLITKQTT